MTTEQPHHIFTELDYSFVKDIAVREGNRERFRVRGDAMESDVIARAREKGIAGKLLLLPIDQKGRLVGSASVDLWVEPPEAASAVRQVDGLGFVRVKAQSDEPEVARLRLEAEMRDREESRRQAERRLMEQREEERARREAELRQETERAREEARRKEESLLLTWSEKQAEMTRAEANARVTLLERQLETERTMRTQAERDLRSHLDRESTQAQRVQEQFQAQLETQRQAWHNERTFLIERHEQQVEQLNAERSRREKRAEDREEVLQEDLRRVQSELRRAEERILQATREGIEEVNTARSREREALLAERQEWEREKARLRDQIEELRNDLREKEMSAIRAELVSGKDSEAADFAAIMKAAKDAGANTQDVANKLLGIEPKQADGFGAMMQQIIPELVPALRASRQGGGSAPVAEVKVPDAEAF